ncbi:AraC-type DNA-binding domain-containing protein [Alcanivorax xiamenensis]|uniref:AraC-type DNA-binding domain-containing protein n=1 Tax=Alcanivorax xiamenensis TaxID=1177156 RepID=A0ABQ6Y5X5_9GAMM|nr:AraC family transcriptional regulator [Alcanivorax xiamenensis]KAF0804696.1 AraC-type DNA-binding domain-containing protein [Alcanivorax xiamenensis]
MSQRSVLALMYTLDLLEERGISCAPVLARHGLDAGRLDPNGEIERDRELRLLAELLPLAEDPQLGMEMGKRFGLAGYGPLTMLLMTSATAFDGFQLGVRYQSLTYLYGELSLVPGNDTTALILKPIPLPESVRRILIERDMVGTFKLVNDIQTQLGLDLTPREVWLPLPEPEHKAPYEQFFRAPVKYDMPWCQATIGNRDLALPLPGYNRTAHELYRSQCDALLARRQNPSEQLADRVSAYLDLFLEDFPGAAEVAVTFDLPERTLRRRLSTEGRPFQQLLDEVRLNKALNYLADSKRSVENIARLLGYSEPAAFIRAFQRWTGETPAKHRKAVDS